MIVPIFPLPNVVFFPKTMLPLHIFEERYRTMTREAIEGDRRIVMVLLREGWEADYPGSPAVYDVACLGKIDSYEVLDEGKYNIILAGVSRVRLIREVDHSPYRMAEVELLSEGACDDQASEVIVRHNRLSAVFGRFTELAGGGQEKPPGVFSKLSFEALVNMVASKVNMPVEDKQSLLEMDEVTDRCDVLIPVLERQVEALILVRRFDHIKPKDPGWN